MIHWKSKLCLNNFSKITFEDLAVGLFFIPTITAQSSINLMMRDRAAPETPLARPQPNRPRLGPTVHRDLQN